ncbi:hypothetical protein GWE18_36355 [Bradyrhizobium sp. CSA112]|uniref:DUF6455 family protein n=1 Tax=Bradyrhizobium sp. CSA112 TaxID=2699170 RepID=UPI0023B1D19B|nr:DUF6455 family protein [Bradyrhizobium sp. CSA112]MDE5458189.1 hypothetical protein [Bradyrhizobium sp. CSA112]
MGRFSEWLGRLRDTADLRALGAAELDCIARDLRVSPTELETLTYRGRRGADELSGPLKALGIDETAIARKEPGVLRDMTLVCALCAEKTRCNREIEAETTAQHLHEYCANSYTIDALRTKPKPDAMDLVRGPSCC